MLPGWAPNANGKRFEFVLSGSFPVGGSENLKGLDRRTAPGPGLFSGNAETNDSGKED